MNCEDVGDALEMTAEWFAGRKCLFLIDDIWKTKDSMYGYLPALRQLLLSSAYSRMAITTRDKNIASEAGQAVQFGARDRKTSHEIFLRYFESDISDALSMDASSAESLERILNICGGLPLALGIAGRGARALKDEGRSAELALSEYGNTLEMRQSDLLEKTSPGYGKHNGTVTLRAAIETSLDFLDSRFKAKNVVGDIYIGDMYRRLGVLKAQAWAPLSMLSRLWNVGREDAESIMGQLCTMSLAKREERTYKVVRSSDERTEGGLRIHDLQLEYCQRHCKEIGRWHGDLLDRYLEAVDETGTQDLANEDSVRHGAEDATVGVESRPWWSESVVEDNYVHENVARHLVKAGRHDELRGLLVEARWIKLRLEIGGIVALENDFAELERMQDREDIGAGESTAESSDAEFRVILNALRCSWQYVIHNERELAVQLGARLFDVEESNTTARKLVTSAISNSERPFAEARCGFLPDARIGQVNEVRLGGFCGSLAYSDCRKYIVAAAGEDVAVVEADTLAEKFRLKGHKARVTGVCFLSQSLKIVSGSWDGTVRVWDLNKRNEEAITLDGHTDRVWSVSASADGSRIASGSNDNTVRLWNLQEEASEEETKRRSKLMTWFCCSQAGAETEDVGNAPRRCEVLLGHTQRVNCVCFSPVGTLLASASNDGTVRLWNGHTGKGTGVVFEGHEGRVLCVAFSPDGERVASGSMDKTIRLWSAGSGASLGIVINGHSGWVHSIAFSADGSRMVSASEDSTVQLWNAESGSEIGTALRGHTSWVTCAVFSPDDTRVASVSWDGTLRKWNPDNTGRVNAVRKEQCRSVECAAFSADSARIAVGSRDGTICIRDTQSGRAIGEPLEDHTNWVNCVAFSVDGVLLASGYIDATVRLWNVRTGAALSGALKGHTEWVSKVSFSADGTKLMSYSAYDGCRCLWSVSSGARLWKSHQLNEDTPNEMSDSEAHAAIEAIENQCRADISTHTPVVYYDDGHGAVMMKCNDGDVRLASLPGLPQNASGTLWKHIASRNEFTAVLSNGRLARLKIHL